MTDSVLTLGERIVLASRLAAIEHVRQELEAAKAASALEVKTGGAPSAGFTDESDAPALSRPVGTILADVFSQLEQTQTAVGPTGKRPSRRPRGRAA